MTDYTLKARFGRGGRAHQRALKPGARGAPPAFAYLPNLDAEALTLPNEVQVEAKRVALDHETRTKSGRDQDLVTLEILPRRVQNAPRNLVLSIRGDLADKMNLYDSKGQRLNPNTSGGGRQSNYDVSLRGRRLIVKLESSTLAGTPLSSVSEGRVEILLSERGAAGELVAQDSIALTLARFRFADCLDPAERLYVVETADNTPALRDLKAGLPRGVQLLTVPSGLSGGDTWLQDQFEIGFLEAQGHKMRMILHLPRLKNETAQITPRPGPNLASFVRSHFPSRNVGLFDDLHHRKVAVLQSNGDLYHIDFADTLGVQTRMYAAERLYKYVLRILTNLRVTKRTEREIKNERDRELKGWSACLKTLPELTKLLAKATAEDNAKGGYPDRDMSAAARKAANSATLAEVKQRLGGIIQDRQSPSGTFAFDAKKVRLPITAGATIEVLWSEADDLYHKLFTMLDSVNFGGNIEATPSDRVAPNGRILIGAGKGGRNIDPDIRQLITEQALQPLVELDTTWLTVGHVDEIVAVVPDRRRGEFAFMRASPGLAMRMVDEARKRYLDGLPLQSGQRIEFEQFGAAPRRLVTRPTTHGKHPVTRLLRGKLWLHVHVKDAPQEILPPWIYRDFAEIDTQFQKPGGAVRFSAFQIGRYFIPGARTVDRLYPADISVHELYYLDRLPARKLLQESAAHVTALKAGRVPSPLRKAIEKVGGKVDVSAKVLESSDTWFVRGPWAGYRFKLVKGRLEVQEIARVNSWLEHHHIANATQVLKGNYPDVRILPLPVVYDSVGSVMNWANDAAKEQTCAFTPNLVNLQSVDRVLYVPRPFGPRMSPDHARALVGDLLKEFGMGAAAKLLTPDYIKNRHLTGIAFWIRRERPVYLRGRDGSIGGAIFDGIDTVSDVARFFHDGFPGKTLKEVEDLIFTANRSYSRKGTPFDSLGRLKKGWHRVVIPENSVDIFELWTHLAADLLGLRVKWVDSWYYHVRFGGIHCGTKALRSPRHPVRRNR